MGREHMGRAVRKVAQQPINVLRGRFARQVVNWTPEFMGFGNQLYLWAWAHAHRHERLPHRVLIVDKSRYWLPHFPAVQPHLVERSAVSVVDQRGHFYAYNEQHSGDPRGFTNESRSAFLEEWILPSPSLGGIEEGPLASADVLVINVRRGDFYSNPHHRPEFAMDVVGYLRSAVPQAVEADGAVKRVHVVSDDVPWCREHLGWLADVGELTFPPATDGPIDNFRDVGSAKRLIITNGTFCLWGAALAQTVHGKDGCVVWAPAFFQRRYGAGRCYEYDSDWNFVDDLNGGWQPAWVIDGEDGPCDT